MLTFITNGSRENKDGMLPMKISVQYFHYEVEQLTKMEILKTCPKWDSASVELRISSPGFRSLVLYVTSTVLPQLNSSGGIRQKTVAKTPLTFAEFKIGNCRNHLCLSELDAELHGERLMFAKHFTLLVMKQGTTSVSVHPRSCSPGLRPAWQEGAGVRSPVVSLRRPTGAFLRSCCVSSSSFLCNCYFQWMLPCLFIPFPDLKFEHHSPVLLLCVVLLPRIFLWADRSRMVHNRNAVDIM